MDRMEIGTLSEHTGPFRITGAEFNALIRSATAVPPTRQTQHTYVRPTVIGYNATGQTIPPYSMFTLKGTYGSGEDGTLRVTIEQIKVSTVGGKSMMFTNGNIEIPDSSSANIYLISQTEPVLLQVTDSTTVPTPGQTCGFDFNKFSLSKDGTGLVCLSALVPNDLPHNYIWCLRDGGGCDSTDARWQFFLFGNATSGTWGFRGPIKCAGVTVTATATFQWNDTAAAIKTAILAAFSNLTTSDISVSGGPSPNRSITVVFSNDAGGQNQALPNTEWALNGGAGIGIIVTMAALGHA